MIKYTILLNCILSVLISRAQTNIVENGSFEEAIDTTSNIAITPTTSRHSVNLELGGGSMLYSLGYEYKLSIKENAYYSISSSVGYLGIMDYIVDGMLEDKIINPIAINTIKGNKKIRYYGALGYASLFDIYPTPRWKIKRIKENVTGYEGISYRAFYAALFFLNQGIEYGCKSFFLRWHLTGLIIIDSGDLRMGPWMGVIIGKKIR